MAISLSKIVRIMPGVLAASGSALDLNGLILTDSAYAPVGSVISVTEDTEASDYFGPASMEYSMATVYFKGYNNASTLPGKLLFARFNTADAPTWLRSASLSDITLDELKLLSGTIILTVNGSVVTSTAITLTSVTSFAQAATAIGTAIGASVVVTYDTTQKAFIITSATSGDGSTITYATGTLATGLRFTSATGAVLSQGADAIVDPTVFFQTLLGQSQDWVAFTTSFTCDVDQHVAFAKFANDSSHRFAYVGHDNNTVAAVQGSTENMAYAIITTHDYADTIPIYGDATHAANVLGFGAALNMNAINGRRTLAFRVTDGLLPMVGDDTTYDALIANGYSFYGTYSGNNYSTNQWYNGAITGPYLWYDAFLGQVWLNANLQKDIITLFQSETYIPYANAGRALVEGCMADTIAQFITWGGISIGTTLDTSQIQAIKNATLVDVSSSLSAKGFYLYIGPFTATMRANRTSPNVALYYDDGSAIQQLFMTSNEVQ